MCPEVSVAEICFHPEFANYQVFLSQADLPYLYLNTLAESSRHATRQSRVKREKIQSMDDALERAVVSGVAGAGEDPGRPDELVDELAEHLRAILRDALCGHLDADLCAMADELLAESAAAPAA